MGTLNWVELTYCSRGNKNIPSTAEAGSGSASTSTSAGNVSGFTPRGGGVVRLTADEPMWVRFGARAAAVGTGIFIGADQPHDYEVAQEHNNLAVSAIDVS